METDLLRKGKTFHLKLERGEEVSSVSRGQEGAGCLGNAVSCVPVEGGGGRL